MLNILFCAWAIIFAELVDPGVRRQILRLGGSQNLELNSLCYFYLYISNENCASFTLYYNRILKWGIELKNKRKGRPIP